MRISDWSSDVCSSDLECAALDLDVAVVAAYGLILPRPILDAPRDGCLNVHGSILPRWRGAAPVQRAILAGATETGVTILQMDAGLDTGGLRPGGRTPVDGQGAEERRVGTGCVSTRGARWWQDDKKKK